jgi:hypothetical protein
MAGTHATTRTGLRTRRALRETPPRRRLAGDPGRLVWLGVAAALVAALWLAVATVAEPPTVTASRADQAATARLEGLAEEYEAARSARANAAATDRLQGLAEEYEAARATRANAAATDRLQGLADEFADRAPDASRLETGTPPTP